MIGPREVSKRRVLASWKEIAAYLGVTVRSVQRWETAGLPVHRKGSGTKARVVGYSDEIQGWLESREGAPPEVEDGPEAITNNRLPYRSWLKIGLPLGLAAFGAAVFLLWRTAGLPHWREPHDWQLDASRLTILDRDGRVCWEKRLPLMSRREDYLSSDKVLIADVEGNGRNEVLFNFAPEKLGEQGGKLMCFDHRGRLRWEFHYGHPANFGGRSFDANYLGVFVRQVKIQGKSRLLTVANHYIWYPSQAALLDPETGRVIEEYWHPGSIYQCVLHDIDGDGVEEVLLGGINNPGQGLGHSALAVLKLPFSKAGQPPGPPNGAFKPAIRGGELAYLLFPHPDTCRALGQLPGVFRLNVDTYNRILVQIPGSIAYYLNFQLQVQEHRFSDDFAAIHERLRRQHLLDHPFTGAEDAVLGKVMRFAAAPDGNSPELDPFWKF